MKKNYTICLILISLALMLCSSCRWDIWGSSSIDYGQGTGSPDSSFLFTGKEPGFVTATQSRYSDKIIISWNSVTGADYYEVFRAEIPALNATQDELVWKRLLEAPMGKTSLVDTDVDAGKFYVYRVRARSLSLRTLIGNHSASTFGWLLSAPVQFTASQGSSSEYIELAWSPVENIQGYKIYYSETGFGGSWNVVIPEGYEEYDYMFSPNVQSFRFVPPNKSLLGKSLFFYITSISKSAVESSPSIQRLGYTFVKGAPAAPQAVLASQGDSPSEITISWASQVSNDPTSPFDWEIYRTAEGLSEKKIYSTRDGDAAPSDADGRMSYVDKSNLQAGKEYTYSIRAIGTTDTGEVVNGLPSQVNGFLLSPPTTVSKVGLTPDLSGFTFTIGTALGAAQHPNDWTYSVYGKSNDPLASWAVMTGLDAIAVTDTSALTITTVFDLTSSNPEHSYEFFTVRTSNGFDESVGYDQVVGTPIQVARPTAADGFNASDNYVYSGMTANAQGIYPVALTLVNDPSVSKYNVRIWHSKPASSIAAADTELFDQEFVLYDDGSGKATNTAIFKNAGTAPLATQWYYSVQGIDVLGRAGEWSDIDAGYGAITGDLLIKHMQAYCLKPWEYIDSALLTTGYLYPNDINTKWKNSQIYGKIKQAGMSSLSDGITEYSYYQNGTIKYVATVQGVGGKVSFNYNKFGEVPYMYTTGSYVMVVSMSGSGSCNGALTVGGMYPAAIGFGNISVSSQAFVGSYTVNQSNGTAAQEISPNQK